MAENTTAARSADVPMPISVSTVSAVSASVNLPTKVRFPA